MQHLLKTQFMLVRGQKHISHYVAWLSKDEEAKMTEQDKTYPAIELDIVIQINGGLKSFTRAFSLGWTKDGLWQNAITFTDWKAWREFYDILYELGYYFSSEKNIDVVAWYSIIKKWIWEVYSEYPYQDFAGWPKADLSPSQYLDSVSSQ